MDENEKKQNADTQTATGDNAQVTEQKQTENKSEGEKTKKQVAQKGDNGSIVFKNQDELDGFVKRMYAKGAGKAEKTEAQTNTKAETSTKQDDESNKAQAQQTSTLYYTDKIALAMAKVGVSVEKVDRAARLVDMTKILIDGNLDATKLKEEIDAVVAEFPELKNTTTEQKEEKGFKFGATQSANQGQTQKKSIPAKRWNRFNSF